MKNVLKTNLLRSFRATAITVGTLSFVFLLAACSDKPSAPTAAEKNMAEMMGITVEELRSQTPEEHMKMMQEMQQKDDHHAGEGNVAPHDHNADGNPTDDHHAGEENVEPHEHDDHHAGETNVEPHDHGEEDKKLPPSRSRLEQQVDDHHAGEENVEPHDH